jgi:hypothetical protein
MKKLFSICLLFVWFSCKNDEKKFDNVSYEKQKESIEQKERKNPLRFLVVEGDSKKNIIGQTVVKMNIKNTATVVTYKNVRVKMLFYDKEGNVFENHEEVLEKQISPGEKQKIKSKYFAQRKTDSIAFTIMAATDVE